LLGTVFSLFWATFVFAHGAAPAPLEILLDSNGEARSTQLEPNAFPDLVRMNIGLAHREEDGTYRYGCPSRWDGYETAQFAVSSDGIELVSLGGGVVRASSDRGCTFEAVEVPEEFGYARDVGWVDGRFYVLGGEETKGALISFGLDRVVRIETTFSSAADDGGFAPDTLSLQSGSPGLVVVAGARPLPQIWKALLPGEGQPTEDWSHLSSPLEGDWNYLSVRHLAVDGTIWLVASTMEGRILVRIQPHPSEDGEFTWSRSEETFENLMGPVEIGSSLVLIADGKSALIEEAANSLSVQQGVDVDWTCLQSVGGYTYVCRLKGVSRMVEPFDVMQPEDTPLFSMNQLGEPGEVCEATDEESLACELDWYHFGGEAGLLDRPPWTDPLGPPSSSGGCNRGREGTVPGLFLIVLLMGLSMRSREISSRDHQSHPTAR